jgi:hypothetical protein
VTQARQRGIARARRGSGGCDLISHPCVPDGNRLRSGQSRRSPRPVIAACFAVSGT